LWHWNLTGRNPAQIDWGEPADGLAFPRGEMIDLTCEPGVRLWVRADEHSARLVLQFHHASCDGVGGLLATRDLLAEYSQLVEPTKYPPLSPLDVGLLTTRDSFGIGHIGMREQLGHVGAMLSEGARLLFRRPTALAAPHADNSDARHLAPFPGLIVHRLKPDEVQSLQVSAREMGVTLNDLLVCHAFRAVVDWNALHGVDNPRNWLRVNMPTNLRLPGDERMPATNLMSFTFIDRRARDCQDVRPLLESIRDETKFIKHGRRGLYFIAQLEILRGLPGTMSLAVSPSRCYATIVVSNVGDLTKMFPDSFPRLGSKVVLGNLVLESIAGTPPLRPLTRAGLGLITYGGEMSICLVCDRHLFTAEDSRRFLDLYAARVVAGIN